MRTITLSLILLSATACRQDMAQQPSARPFRPGTTFVDVPSQSPVGTIARGTSLSSGMRPITQEDWIRIGSIVGTASDNPLAAAMQTTNWSFYREAFPSPITNQVLERGQERFNIYCAVCHDRVGTGKGIVVERGFTAPPSLHDDWSRGFKLKGANLKVRDAPVGYYYEIITHGFGAMPDYAAQIPADDRWAIIAYIRALQLSQRATLAEVRDERAKADLSKQVQP